MSRLTTFQYKDGSTFSQEWDPILDGEWPHDEKCVEVIYKLDMKNPLYEQYD